MRRDRVAGEQASTHPVAIGRAARATGRRARRRRSNGRPNRSFPAYAALALRVAAKTRRSDAGGPASRSRPRSLLAPVQSRLGDPGVGLRSCGRSADESPGARLLSGGHAGAGPVARARRSRGLGAAAGGAPAKRPGGRPARRCLAGSCRRCRKGGSRCTGPWVRRCRPKCWRTCRLTDRSTTRCKLGMFLRTPYSHPDAVETMAVPGHDAPLVHASPLPPTQCPIPSHTLPPLSEHGVPWVAFIVPQHPAVQVAITQAVAVDGQFPATVHVPESQLGPVSPELVSAKLVSSKLVSAKPVSASRCRRSWCRPSRCPARRCRSPPCRCASRCRSGWCPPRRCRPALPARCLARSSRRRPLLRHASRSFHVVLHGIVVLRIAGSRVDRGGDVVPGLPRRRTVHRSVVGVVSRASREQREDGGSRERGEAERAGSHTSGSCERRRPHCKRIPSHAPRNGIALRTNPSALGHMKIGP